MNTQFYEQVIPIQALAAQSFDITLGNQACNITLRQLATGLFMDLTKNGAQVISGVYCNDRVNLVRRTYLGVGGALYFVDTSGQGTDPYYTGLGSQYLLVYEWDL